VFVGGGGPALPAESRGGGGGGAGDFQDNPTGRVEYRPVSWR